MVRWKTQFLAIGNTFLIVPWLDLWYNKENVPYLYLGSDISTILSASQKSWKISRRTPKIFALRSSTHQVRRPLQLSESKHSSRMIDVAEGRLKPCFSAWRCWDWNLPLEVETDCLPQVQRVSDSTNRGCLVQSICFCGMRVDTATSGDLVWIVSFWHTEQWRCECVPSLTAGQPWVAHITSEQHCGWISRSNVMISVALAACKRMPEMSDLTPYRSIIAVLGSRCSHTKRSMQDVDIHIDFERDRSEKFWTANAKSIMLYEDFTF